MTVLNDRPENHRILLVVEDDSAIRSTLALVLQGEGYHVIEAESGHAALSILQTQSVSLVVSDIQMPDGDGLTLLAEAKRVLPNPPPFIFVSAHPTITEEHVKELGAIGLVRKPFAIDEILGRVKTVLNHG